MRKQIWTLFVIASLCLMSCSSNPGITGKTGQWIKGKAISLKATLTNIGVMCELRNDSDKEVSIDPIKLVFWSKSKGKQELSFSAADTGQGAKLQPRESFKLPPLGDTHDSEKLSIYLGPDGSPEQEVFTVTW